MGLKGIVKNMQDPDDLFHRLISCKEGILKLIRDKGTATTPEIMQYLLNNGTSYSRMGLNKLLASMVEENILKNDQSQKINRYSFADKESKVEYFGMLYSSFASKTILQMTPSNVSSSDEVGLVEDLVTKAGVYAIYNQLLGWILSSSGKSESECIKIHQKWLKNVNTMPFLSTYFYFQLKSLKLDNVDNESSSPFSNLDNKIKQIKKLMIVLQNLYPNETSTLIGVWHGIESIHSINQKIKKVMNERKSYEVYKRKVANEKKKRLSDFLKKNQCPRCHFDGTSEVKTGPLKGKKFPQGFAIQFKNEVIEYRYCPQCTYSESKPLLKII